MVSIANLSAIAACNAAVDPIDGGAGNPQGILRIYDGTVPANVDTPLGAQTVLSEHDCSDPAFGAAVDAAPGAIATANAIADDAAANATGTPTFARFFDKSNTLAKLQMTVGTSGAELIINAVPITAGTRVVVTSATCTMPEA